MYIKISWVLIILLFVSCSGKETIKQTVEDTSDSIVQTPINWIGIWQKRESKRKLVQSVIRKFEVENQNYVVNFKFKEEIVEEYENNNQIVEDSIISMLKSGNYAWDIIVLTRNSYKVVADKLNDDEWGKKHLVNLEEFDWFRENHIDKVFEVEEYRDGYGGIFPGPIIEGHNYGLWYNIKTAKKLGLEIKQMGMTFDDFLGYCERVNEYNQTSSDTITFLPNRKTNSQVTDIFNSLVLSELEIVDNELPDPLKVKNALKKGLSALEQLSAHNPVNDSVDVDHEVRQSLNGQVLFTEKPSYWYNKCETEDKDKALNMIPAELPVFTKSAQFYPGTYQSVWAIFKNGTNKDAALDIMKYFTSNDVAERWLSTTFNPTGLKVKLKASDFGQNEIEKFNDYIDNKYGDNLKGFELGEILYGKKGIKIEPLKVLKGEITADEFYQTIVSQL